MTLISSCQLSLCHLPLPVTRISPTTFSVPTSHIAPVGRCPYHQHQHQNNTLDCDILCRGILYRPVLPNDPRTATATGHVSGGLEAPDAAWGSICPDDLSRRCQSGFTAGFIQIAQCERRASAVWCLGDNRGRRVRLRVTGLSRGIS